MMTDPLWQALLQLSNEHGHIQPYDAVAWCDQTHTLSFRYGTGDWALLQLDSGNLEHNGRHEGTIIWQA